MRRILEYALVGALGLCIMASPALGVPLMAISDPGGNQIVGVTQKGEVMIMPGSSAQIGVSNWPSTFDINFPNPLPVSMATTLPVSIATTLPVVMQSVPPLVVSSMPPIAGAVTMAQNSSGPSTPTACDTTARISGTTSAVLIAHTAAKTTYVCSYAFSLDLTVSATASLKWGTGTNCGSNTAQMSPALVNAALGLLTNGQTSLGTGVGAIDQSPTAGTSDLCIVISGGGNATGSLRYASY